MKNITVIFGIVFIFSLNYLSAKENVGSSGHRNASPESSLASGCTPATAQTDLDINNVRARILTGGDMWWDLISARYEVPKGSNKFSLFAGALWIGGIDAGGQLKVAAMTYRQTGNDFWPGPVNATTVSITPSECNKYDKHWKITLQEVQDFVNWYCNPGAYPNYGTPPLSITSWPGNSDYGAMQSLAPYYDNNGDGQYNSADGDYPYYNISGCNHSATTTCPPLVGCLPSVNYLFGDETLWWVFNDVGNIHSETGGQPIGLEIQAQAFAFQTSDEINNMTFYQYKIINRSTYTVNDTYIGQWVDADLGYAYDDYVGCDVSRGLGYCYNGAPVDPGPTGYGANPPAVGVDFFQGPIADAHDGIDNNRNCVVDEPCEQIIMSKFVYYNNDFSIQGNPQNGTQYYGYLKGFWKDGTPFTYGGSGYGGSTPCGFMFPDNSDDTYGWGLGGTCQNPVTVPFHWNEAQAGDAPFDRRFMQSAGHFTLKPGAVNMVTTGVVWARATSGGPAGSVAQLKLADDKAQSLFDNCFKVLNGPDAPDMTLRELDREIIISISNNSSSNNYKEQYSEKDPTIICDTCDQYYRFEGYQIFQIADPTVTYSDIFNPLTGGYNLDKARLVAQCDKKDGVGQIINFYLDPTLSALVPVEVVNGSDSGIAHTFKVNQDMFTGTTLINHLPYYYTVVAYGYNNFKTFNPNDPNSLDGQQKPYFPGRLNVKSYSAIPHIPAPDNGGQVLGSDYGAGPQLKRIQGQGNGGMVLEMTEQTIDEIMASASNRSLNPVYQNTHGPVNIKVYDPVAVPNNNFKIIINDSVNTPVNTSSLWKLINTDTKETVYSETTIAAGNEQIIPNWGLSVDVVQVPNPGVSPLVNETNGFLSGTMTFADPTKSWLTGVPDADGAGNPFNWIRSGTYAPSSGANSQDFDAETGQSPNFVFLDPNQNYEKIIGGTWAPYRLVDTVTFYQGTDFGGPGYGGSGPTPSQIMNLNHLSSIASVDIVITSDKSKWSRCNVVETSSDPILSQGNAHKLYKRKHASVDQNGNNENSGTGMGWFPGYAINLETGERLNIMFGEDSWFIGDNGTDMKWNPTSSVFSPDFSQFFFGGRHYIYVMNTKYDKCHYYDSLFTVAESNYAITTPILSIWKTAMWVSMPLLAPNQQFMACDVKVSLRVAKEYDPYDALPLVSYNGNNPIYTFNTGDIYNNKNNATAATNALDLINAVPNPYYAFSSYEQGRIDNRIYITNLPSKCVVSIYTLNGTLIRQFNRDVAGDTSPGSEADVTNLETSLSWDLKNTAGIPIASGLYLIHIKTDQGEKVLKWFGVLRPLDLSTF